ncbi:MAG: hypothetical protein ABS36_12380 [Acidobacteria bacterium SCN 69-37]|nr:MAG: hypothetical protein ABS36_12380 [Acidobacteria bacterium SCN 69-37]
MRTVIGTATIVITLGWIAATAGQERPALEAFSHYEQIRVALSAETLAETAKHAKALAPLVGAVVGNAAKKAADQLAAAKTLEDARAYFGDLSVLLVPKFQAEGIPGAHAYMCPMKQKPWIQRGDTMSNPYFGKAMANCGSPLAPQAK